MIKAVEEGQKTAVEIKGNKLTLLSEFTSITKGLIKGTNITKDDIQYAVKLGFMDDEELEEEANKMLNDRIKDDLRAKFDKLLEILDQEDMKHEEDPDTLLDKLRKRFK